MTPEEWKKITDCIAILYNLDAAKVLDDIFKSNPKGAKDVAAKALIGKALKLYES